MMTRDSGSQARFCLVDWEALIPEDHLLRQIHRTIDFHFIYDLLKNYDSPIGRPSIDPVLLFKMMLIGYLYGIPSERRLEQEVRLNLAYRWFLGLEVDDPVPDHSTLSQNRRRRFGEADFFQSIFDDLVRRCVKQGLVTGEWVVTDSTHVKAHVAPGNETTIYVTKPPSQYLQDLDAEAERLAAELHARKPKGTDEDKVDPPTQGGSPTPPEVKAEKVNLIDPDARRMHRKGKPSGFYYLSHQSIDAAHGLIIDVHTTPGNINDHEPYADRLDRIEKVLRSELTSS